MEVYKAEKISSVIPKKVSSE